MLPGAAAGPRKLLLARLCLVAALQAGSAAALAIAVADAGRDLLGGGGLDAASITLIALAVPFIGGLRWVERVEAERLGQSYVLALRETLARRVLRTPAQALVGRAHGAMLLRFTGDMSAFRNWAARGLARAIVGGATVGAGLAALTWLDPAIGLAFACGAAASISAAYCLARPLAQAAREARRSRVRLARSYGETIAALGGYQAFGGERSAARKIRREAKAVQRRSVAQARAAGAIQAIAEASAVGLPVLALLAAAGFGADAGAAFAGMTAAGLLSSRLRDLGRTPEYFANAQVAKERLLAALDSLPAKQRLPRANPRPPDGALVLSGLRAAPVLLEATAEARTGERVALVGNNGSGKSTLLAAIAGLAPTAAGIVWLDGRACSSLRPGALAGEIALVGDAAPIIAGSVRRNLKLAVPAADDSQIDAAIKAFGLTELANRRSRIAALGRNLSSGERMRLLLARALLAQPKVILADEWEANLDADGRAAAERLLSEFTGILICATHDPASIARADRVWRLADGVLRQSEPARSLHNHLRPVG